MKPFNTVVVFVEWRCQSEGVPEDRLVRARVVETITRSGGSCRQFGAELIAPRKITDHHLGQVHTICIEKLRELADRIVFRYEPLMGLADEVYPPVAVVEVA